MKAIEINSLITNLIAVSFFVSIVFFPMDAYSQDEYVNTGGNVTSTTTGANGGKAKGGKGAKGGGRNVQNPVQNTPGVKLTFDKATNTLSSSNGWEYQFVVVRGNKFMMGSEPENNVQSAYGTQAHMVNLETFGIGNIEVQRWLWQAVMNTDPFTPGIVEGNDLSAPVNNVSWDDCQSFITKLNKITGMTFALPTEAQWEYAARGGEFRSNTKYSGTNNEDQLPTVANSLGIHSMSGLYKEWCYDSFEPWNENTFDKNSCPLNPKGGENSDTKVVRGGSDSDYDYMKVTTRDCCERDERSHDIGFRLVLQMFK